MTPAKGAEMRQQFMQDRAVMAKQYFDSAKKLEGDLSKCKDDVERSSIYLQMGKAMKSAYFEAGRLFHVVQDKTSSAHTVGGQMDKWPSIGDGIHQIGTKIYNSIMPDKLNVQDSGALEEFYQHLFSAEDNMKGFMEKGVQAQMKNEISGAVETYFNEYQQYFRMK